MADGVVFGARNTICSVWRSQIEMTRGASDGILRSEALEPHLHQAQKRGRDASYGSRTHWGFEQRSLSAA